MKTMLLLILAVLCAWPAAGRAANAPSGGGFPTEVEIKAEGGVRKLNAVKPPLTIEVDPFETIRPSLEPDQSLLLAVSPLTVSWRRTHPEFLHNQRVIEPWLMTFSQRPGIALRVRDQLFVILGRKLEPKEAKGYAWNLTIADEEGRVFHHYESSNDPPEELIWSGQNDQGEWIKAGRSYSAVYTFTDPAGAAHTSVGKPLLFKGIVHQEDTGLHVTLDSSALFGVTKTGSELAVPAGSDLLRSAADLIKRRFTGIPIAVRVFATTKELADTQASVVQNRLIQELKTMSKNVAVEGARAAFSDQRVEIVLLNR
ncbi:MAG: hypothetical protein NTY77_05340 [Elusimicrobia bacterium]|nr:hypothetical protein [Elusimicrobiota bacterium]